MYILSKFLPIWHHANLYTNTIIFIRKDHELETLTPPSWLPSLLASDSV